MKSFVFGLLIALLSVAASQAATVYTCKDTRRVMNEWQLVNLQSIKLTVENEKLAYFSFTSQTHETNEAGQDVVIDYYMNPMNCRLEPDTTYRRSPNSRYAHFSGEGDCEFGDMWAYFSVDKTLMKGGNAGRVIMYTTHGESPDYYSFTCSR